VVFAFFASFVVKTGGGCVKSRRLAIAGFIVAALISMHAQSKADAAAATTKLADEFVAAQMQRNPETATFFGLPDARHDAVFDNTLEARRAWDARIDTMQTAFRAIDQKALAGRPELLTYGFLEQALASETERRVCRAELWGVDHLNGWQVSLPAVLSRQPVATDADRQAALTRLGQYGRFIEREIEVLRTGMSGGYTAPRVNVERVIGQIDGLLAGTADASPFASPITTNSSDAAFRRSVVEVVGTQIAPALKRYRSFLDEYRGVARTTVGVAAIPRGEACYRSLVRDNTSLELDVEEVHQLGLTMMAQIHAEMRTIGARAFATSDIPALIDRLRNDPALRFKAPDEIMKVAAAALARSRTAIPKYFGRLPKADVQVRAFEPFEAPSMPPAMYRQASLDGSKPGLYMVNLHRPEQLPRADVEAIAFHEAIPGHHLQIALAMERPAAHRITQIFGATAFIEGWGLYAERLADEMGLYSGDLDRLGMLSAASWRAARLVVDTGMHAKQWTREQAVDYMRRNTAIGENTIQTEIDRYIIMPGQALAYMIGYREITSLRAKATAALGPRFDIRAFHDAVLGRGAVTLPMLRAQIEAWIGQVESKK
jgi:uncharacterized protein (DUF885 family)